MKLMPSIGEDVQPVKVNRSCLTRTIPPASRVDRLKRTRERHIGAPAVSRSTRIVSNLGREDHALASYYLDRHEGKKDHWAR